MSTADKDPMWIECEVDCDADEDGSSFDLDVVDIDGDQGQLWDNSMKIEFIEKSAYDALKAELDELKQDKARLSGIVYGQSIDLKEIGKENNETKAENERLKQELAEEKERADGNFESCERIKQKYSDHVNRAAKLVGALKFYGNGGIDLAPKMSKAHLYIKDFPMDSPEWMQRSMSDYESGGAARKALAEWEEK